MNLSRRRTRKGNVSRNEVGCPYCFHRFPHSICGLPGVGLTRKLPNPRRHSVEVSSTPNHLGKRCHISSLATSTALANSILHGSHALCNDPGLPFAACPFTPPALDPPGLRCIKSASIIAKRGSELVWKTTPFTSLRTSKVVASKVTWQTVLRFVFVVGSPPGLLARWTQFADGTRPSSSVTMNIDRNCEACSRPLRARKRSASERAWCTVSPVESQDL